MPRHGLGGATARYSGALLGPTGASRAAREAPGPAVGHPITAVLRSNSMSLSPPRAPQSATKLQTGLLLSNV